MNRFELWLLSLLAALSGSTVITNSTTNASTYLKETDPAVTEIGQTYALDLSYGVQDLSGSNKTTFNYGVFTLDLSKYNYDNNLVRVTDSDIKNDLMYVSSNKTNGVKYGTVDVHVGAAQQITVTPYIYTPEGKTLYKDTPVLFKNGSDEAADYTYDFSSYGISYIRVEAEELELEVKILDGDEVLSDETVSYNDEVIMPELEDKGDYEFLGFLSDYDNEIYESGEAMTVKADTTCYSVFIKKDAVNGDQTYFYADQCDASDKVDGTWPINGTIYSVQSNGTAYADGTLLHLYAGDYIDTKHAADSVQASIPESPLNGVLEVTYSGALLVKDADGNPVKYSTTLVTDSDTASEKVYKTRFAIADSGNFTINAYDNGADIVSVVYKEFESKIQWQQASPTEEEIAEGRSKSQFYRFIITLDNVADLDKFDSVEVKLSVTITKDGVEETIDNVTPLVFKEVYATYDGCQKEDFKWYVVFYMDMGTKLEKYNYDFDKNPWTLDAKAWVNIGSETCYETSIAEKIVKNS